jgi:Uncharacterized protein conserved in bacteria (DUF2334)
MRYVIIRDDDTNALTPPECLERLYRPFLDAGLPVNLATIPAVATDVHRPDGQLEGFLWKKTNGQPARETLPLHRGHPVVEYLRANPGYHIVQHGFHHDPFEFDCEDREQVANRLEQGRKLFADAGLSAPETFVAPHDKFSRVSYQEVARRFQVISTGWFELRRLPYRWWPQYASVKARRSPHWRINGTTLLSHPGCLLSYMRPYASILANIKREIASRSVTVLVTHWWEYFRDGKPDEEFIAVLHSLAHYLRQSAGLKVVSFGKLALEKPQLN